MDPRSPATPDRAPLDDAALAALVRDVADEWSMPPQRLDGLTWRDQVRAGRHAGHGGSGLRWTRRMRGAAAVAAVIVVSASVSGVAIWRAASRDDHDSAAASASPAGSPASVSSDSPTPTASALPKLLRNGDLPTPSRIMTVSGRGYRIADLGTGELGDVLVEVGYGPTFVLPRPGGGWVCICGEGQNVVRLALRTIDANGLVGAPTPLRDVVGTADPNTPDGLRTSTSSTTATVSPDGRFGLIGWSHRDGAAGWRLGADVLDLATLETVDSTEFLLDEPVAIDGRLRVRAAPLARLSPAGDRIVIVSNWFIDAPDVSPTAGVDHWLASFDGQAIGTVTEAGSTNNEDCFEVDAGPIDVRGAVDDAVYYQECAFPDRPTAVRRVAADGRLVSSTEIPGALGNIDGTVAPPAGDAVYLWNPFETVLSKVDLRTGELSVGEPQRPNPTGRTLSNDLAVVSADGSRVYTLGIESDDRETADSVGVYAFDASTLAPLGHWEPTAAFDSIAVSDDGSYVYAAATGGISATGDPGPEFGASITAYDTSDGSVVVLAGRLGIYDLTLGEGVCR
jgi:hypothetical protein